MHKEYKYRVVDVFTATPLSGNPLAVFPDAEGMDTQLMQSIAREFNLSETAFILPPSRSDCAARVRIFTPAREMDFAGHPTVGTAYVLHDEGKLANEVRRFALEENVGPIQISMLSGKFWLTSPPLSEEDVVDRRVGAELLGLHENDLLDRAPQIITAGNPTLYIALKNPAAVDRAALDIPNWKRFKLEHLKPMAVFIFATTGEGAYSRMFAPDHGVHEDPATGSSTGPLAFYMMKHGLVSSKSGTSFLSEQGTKMGRRSILHVRIEGDWGSDLIMVGGDVTPVMQGTLTI